MVWVLGLYVWSYKGKKKNLWRGWFQFFFWIFWWRGWTMKPDFQKKDATNPPKISPRGCHRTRKLKNAQKANICPTNLQKGWISPRMFPGKPPKHLWLLPFRGAFSRGDVAGGVEELWRRFCYWTWKWRILYHQTFQVPKMEEFWPIRVI